MNPTKRKPGAVQMANAVAESVQYQGRKTHRQRSEQRRQAILDASMRIITREGVRSVRHRAVAQEAGVPLSATTYYFKDINDLITDTFALFIERNAAYLSEFWRQIEEELKDKASAFRSGHIPRERLVEEIARRTLEFILLELQQRRDYLVAEKAFIQEALINPSLHELFKAHRCIMLEGLTNLFLELGSDAPQADAVMMASIIADIEYLGLIEGVEYLRGEQVCLLLQRFLQGVLGNAVA